MLLEISILGVLEVVSISFALLISVITNAMSLKRYVKKKDDERLKWEKELENKVDQILESQKLNELSRIKGQILEFSDKLRLKKELSVFGDDIYDININSFNLIFLEYEKYKKLGGNSYIDIEMDFIRKEYDIQQHYGK